MLWQSTPGETVREVLDLTPTQREMTLREYESRRCDVCGVRGVETHDRDGSHVCALCVAVRCDVCGMSGGDAHDRNGVATCGPCDKRARHLRRRAEAENTVPRATSGAWRGAEVRGADGEATGRVPTRLETTGPQISAPARRALARLVAVHGIGGAAHRLRAGEATIEIVDGGGPVRSETARRLEAALLADRCACLGCLGCGQ